VVDSRVAPAPRALPLVGGARLPLAFIVLGLFALGTGLLWLVLDGSLIHLPYLHPRVVACVHLWLPGFLLSAAIGALYQLMPVVLGTPLQAASSALWVHFGAHATGVTAMVIGFFHVRFDWVAAGGGLVAAGAFFLFFTVLTTFMKASRRDVAAWSFPLATGWLALTVSAGLALASNRHAPWLPLSAVDLLHAHAHLGLAGFFLTLLQGTTFQLVPMFTMGEPRRGRLAWCGLLATQTGLPVLAAGFALDLPFGAVTGAVILLIGVVCTLSALRATLRTRRRRALEPGLKAFVSGFCLLAIAAAGGVVLLLASLDSTAGPKAITAYGIALIAGALSLCILGMLCKIIPFLVWMRAYGPKVGKQTVPLATSLASKRLEAAWFYSHVGAIGILVPGILLSSRALTLLGATFLAGAVGAFLVNVVRILRHLGNR
jgi:hypothetical protein